MKLNEFIFGNCPACGKSWKDGKYSLVWYGTMLRDENGNRVNDRWHCPFCGVQFDADTFERIEE